MKTLGVSCLIFLFTILGWNNNSIGEQNPTPRGELRIVDTHPLNWAFIVYNVFEHLMELDKDGTLVPRLATSWQWINDRTLAVSLRQGVKFHNGEVFDAEIVKLNWEEYTRLKQPFLLGSFMNFQLGSRLDIIDPYKVRFTFPEPDGGVMRKLGSMHMGNRQFYRDFGWGEKSW